MSNPSVEEIYVFKINDNDDDDGSCLHLKKNRIKVVLFHYSPSLLKKCIDFSNLAWLT